MTGSPTPVAIGPGEREEAGRSVRSPDVSRRRAGRRGRGCREVRQASWGTDAGVWEVLRGFEQLFSALFLRRAELLRFN